jgi:hypothetical protein
VIATNTDGESTTASIGTACAFSLTLAVNQSYAISFLLDDAFVASLVFNASAQGDLAEDFYLGEGVEDLDLGTITFTGGVAVSEQNPLEGEDCDDDGESDDGDGDGEIIAVPAHGRDPGEYISKLGRVWMPSFQDDGTRQMWSSRLARLLRELEQTHQPDIVLIDSRAGIDEVASACVTDLGANRIYLFALDGLQTWTGYRMLFQHWLQHGVAQQIREHIQLVGAMLPTWHDQPQQAAADLKERSYNLFLETLYDEQPAAINEIEDLYPFSFDIDDPDAPHNPLLIPWNQSFAAIQTHHARLEGIDPRLVELVYDKLIADLSALLEGWGS